MKIISTLGHPALLIMVYLLLLIEGDHFGGFYLLYLLLALPHGALYAILAVAGIVLIAIHYYFKVTRLVSLAGSLLLLISLVIFFSKGNKNETFMLAIPLLTFCLFGVCLTCYLIRSIVSSFPFYKLPKPFK